MKKLVFCIIPLLVIMGCASGGTTVATTDSTAVVTTVGSSPGIDLDVAIKEATAQMEARLPAKTKVALVSIASSSTQFSEYVISRLEAALVSGDKLVVVDRANLDRIREEQGFQLSGEVDDDSAKAIGKLLGAGAIVTGSFIDLGDVYGLNLKAINMESAAIAASYPADIAKSSRIETLLASRDGAAGTQLAQGGNVGRNRTALAQPDPVQAVQAPASPEKVYNIGDAGPAGGIIFYDKGNNSNGWRYLEAAPASTEFKAPWGADKANINTDTDIGSGKRNTEIIVKYLWDNGQNGAALLCDELSVNGFNDWFLPSKGELNLMYMRLKLKSLGNFRQNWYWSSSKDSGRLVWVQTFSDGKQWDSTYYYADDIFIRAIRQF